MNRLILITMLVLIVPSVLFAQIGWTEYTIDGDFNGAHSVFAIDLDSDGDIDVLGGAQTADDITWWESDLAISDAGPASIDIPSIVPEDTTLGPQAIVMNLGTVNATFDVTCEIDPGAYTSTETVTDLTPGDSIQVTFFPDFTFATGSYTVTVYTQLAGDENTANDTLEKVIETHDPGIADGGNSLIPTIFSFGLKNNPAKDRALFNLALPEAATISLQIYDVTGRQIDRITGQKSAGYYEVPWDSKVTAGVYFYKLESPWQTKNGKIVLVR